MERGLEHREAEARNIAIAACHISTRTLGKSDEPLRRLVCGAHGVSSDRAIGGSARSLRHPEAHPIQFRHETKEKTLERLDARLRPLSGCAVCRRELSSVAQGRR